MKKVGKVWRNKNLGGTTFIIRILKRTQNNWKGEIRWLEGRKTIAFRSLLEMILLLHEALEEQGLSARDCNLRSWEQEIEEKNNRWNK